jgi:hypothetical protein
MWKMTIDQAIFQLVVTLIMYFVGPETLNYDHSSPGKILQLDTVIFNSFVWTQINEFNNRRLDNKFNIFEGPHRNQFFIFINCLMVSLQVGISLSAAGRSRFPRKASTEPCGLSPSPWRRSRSHGPWSSGACPTSGSEPSCES